MLSPTSGKEVTAVMNMTTASMNTAAYAQDACAASACSAMNSMIVILDVSLLLASLILLPVHNDQRMTVHRSPLCQARQAA